MPSVLELQGAVAPTTRRVGRAAGDSWAIRNGVHKQSIKLGTRLVPAILSPLIIRKSLQDSLVNVCNGCVRVKDAAVASDIVQTCLKMPHDMQALNCARRLNEMDLSELATVTLVVHLKVVAGVDLPSGMMRVATTQIDPNEIDVEVIINVVIQSRSAQIRKPIVCALTTPVTRYCLHHLCQWATAQDAGHGWRTMGNVAGQYHLQGPRWEQPNAIGVIKQAAQDAFSAVPTCIVISKMLRIGVQCGSLVQPLPIDIRGAVLLNPPSTNVPLPCLTLDIMRELRPANMIVITDSNVDMWMIKMAVLQHGGSRGTCCVHVKLASQLSIKALAAGRKPIDVLITDIAGTITVQQSTIIREIPAAVRFAVYRHDIRRWNDCDSAVRMGCKCVSTYQDQLQNPPTIQPRDNCCFRAVHLQDAAPAENSPAICTIHWHHPAKQHFAVLKSMQPRACVSGNINRQQFIRILPPAVHAKDGQATCDMCCICREVTDIDQDPFGTALLVAQCNHPVCAKCAPKLWKCDAAGPGFHNSVQAVSRYAPCPLCRTNIHVTALKTIVSSKHAYVIKAHPAKIKAKRAKWITFVPVEAHRAIERINGSDVCDAHARAAISAAARFGKAPTATICFLSNSDRLLTQIKILYADSPGPQATVASYTHSHVTRVGQVRYNVILLNTAALRKGCMGFLGVDVAICCEHDDVPIDAIMQTTIGSMAHIVVAQLSHDC
jgi:hypothetical protein